MSEYSYQKLSQDEFIIYAPDGRIVGKEVFQALAKDKVEVLNQETASLLARIADLEAVATHCIGTLERTMYANTPNDIEEAIDHAKAVRYKKVGDNE